eukprot:scaffold10836_cov77-Isochrysis_galbana.AAC.1
MTGIFRKADTDGSGTLSLPELHAALRHPDLGLTRREVNYLMFSADLNGNRELSWQVEDRPTTQPIPAPLHRPASALAPLSHPASSPLSL